jgi:selenocysteine-specific elongation factor
MIVGTAGHIDHGKTSLIKALTGTDADRLPEEKARGITVDLGFAYQHFSDAPSISFLDVPGHEKLIHNMLAGAIGIDFVMLVVAADDGVMPQTREHLAVIDLIGVRRGVIALTKIDRVDAGRVAEVETQIRNLTIGTTLEDATVMACSTVSGAGTAALSQFLQSASRDTAARKNSGNFRLAVDRCFTLPGIGLVVTGTVYSGAVKAGDTLTHSPSGTDVRVRGVRAENREAEGAHAGQRCALNLTGRKFEKEHVRRGDWIVAPECHAPVQRLDVRLRLLRQETRALKHWTPVHVHIGAADVSGRVGLLEDKALEPGATTLAQLIVDSPIGALYGDRFVIRDQSALRTMGGGHVIDSAPPQRGARTPERLRLLGRLDQTGPKDALRGVLAESPNGIDAKSFRVSRNLTSTEAAALFADAGVVEINSGAALIGFSAEHWTSLQTDVAGLIAEYQRTHADSPGASIEELMRLTKEPRRRIVAREALKAQIESGAVLRYGQLVHLPGHEVKLSDGEEALWMQIEEALRAAGYDQPRVNDLAAKLELQPEALLPLLSKLGHIGRLRRVSKAYFMLPEIVTRLADEAKTSAETHPEQLLTVGRYRDVTKVSRHMVMPLMEFFDKAGFTRRIKDGRQIRNDWTQDPS